MPLSLRQIEVFRAVMGTQSISGAARLLHVSQPAVSRLLSYTESRLGFPLFDRKKGRLCANPDARRLFSEVEAVFVSVQRVNEVARAITERQQGVLHIVSSPSIGQLLMPQVIANFYGRHPNVKLTFQFMSHSYLVERVLNRQADIGVAILPTEHPNLEVKPIGEGKIVCICPPAHPLSRLRLITIADLTRYPLISYNKTTPFGIAVRQLFDDAAESLAISVEVGSPQNACALVQMGVGIALVDEFSVRNWPDPHFVVLPLSPAVPLRVNVLHACAEPLSHLAQSFVLELCTFIADYGFALPQPDVLPSPRPAARAKRPVRPQSTA